MKIAVFKSVLFLGIVFLMGYYLRSVKPEYYPLGPDQIQILQNAQQIQQKHFVLLGPRTGPAPMFTGPLIYYVAAFFLFFTKTPYVLVSTSLALYTITFLISVWLVYRYLEDNFLRWLVVGLLALSPYQVSLDRIPWNPNITFLAAILVFLPLLHKEGKKLELLDILCIMMGSFLGYQAHFSALLLPGYVVLACALWYRKQWWVILLSGMGLLLSLVPTAVFDRRHDYFNLKGLLFILKQGGSPTTLKLPWWIRLYNDCLVTLENLGKTIAFTAPHHLLMTTGLAILVLFIWIYRKEKEIFVWPLLWIFSLDIIFLFYQGPKPEYYFLLQFPALFYLCAQLVKPLLKNNVQVTSVILGFGLYSVYSLSFQQMKPPSLYLKNQMEAADSIRALRKDDKAIVVYDMKDVDVVGMKYLLSDLPSGPATTSAQSIHVIYPYFHDSPITREFGELAIWEDPRTNSQKNYLVRKEVVISTPLADTLLESHYHQKVLDPADADYFISKNNQMVGHLYFLDDKASNGTYNDFMDANMKQWDRQQKKWQQIKLDGQLAFVRPTAGTTIFAIFSDPKMNLGDQFNFLNAMEIIAFDK